LDKWFKLNLAKKLINPAVRVLNLLIPAHEPVYPQTKILARVYADLLSVYRIEAYCGRFDDIPRGTLETLKDKNFLRFLQLSNKVLTYLGDTDRYYRAWLGLFFLLIRDYVETLPLAEAGKSVSQQWDYPVGDKIFQQFASVLEKDAREIILANQLYNLVPLTLNRGDENHEHSTNRS
jgi:hypothetical protein